MKSRDDIEGIATRFGEHFRKCSPFEQDRQATGELEVEVRPLLRALFASLGERDSETTAIEHYEALTMANLLGRRAGVLAITPTAALAIITSIDASLSQLSSEGAALGPKLARVLETAVLEGYFAAREETLHAESSQLFARSQVMVEAAPRCLLIFLAGEMASEDLSRVVDACGKELLRRDARACVIDIERLLAPTPERAREVFSIHASARMLGATPIFSGLSAPWIEAGRLARVDTQDVITEPDFERAFERALRHSGHVLRAASGLEKLAFWLKNR